MTTQDIISAFTTTNEDGSVSSFDFDSFNALVDELVETRKALKKEAKEAEKEKKEAEREVLAEAGKKYYDSLAEGDEFEYKNSEGTILKARKIKTKSNTGSTAACELLEFTTKTGKRYPKFYQVIVPAAA